MPGALSAGTVSLGVKPNSEGFGKTLSAGILGDSASFNGIGKKIGGLVVGGLAAAGVGISIGKIFSTGFDEAKDASAGVAQLTAGIVSTGNAAHVSVEGMESLASSIQNMSGQTDDSVVKAQQLLLTFTNIKNQGPDKIFDDATLAAANMAAKMGGDASSQAILLGKALNDPVKGVTALTRVGVSFTEGQKKQIAAMVDTGNTIGAQKLILGELNKEFGGAAKAAGESLPGQLARTKRAFEDISQSVVEGILPIVTPAIVGIAGAMQKAAPYVDKFSAAMSVKLAAAAAVLPRVGGAVVGLYNLVAKGNFTGGLGKALGIEEDSPIVGIVLTIRDGVIGAFKSIKTAVGPIFDALVGAFKQLWPAIQPLIPQVVALFTAFSPIQIIFKALTPVLPAIVSLLGTLGTTLAGALGSALKVVLPVLTKLAGIISTEFMKVVQLLIPVIVKLVGVIGPLLGTVLAAVAPIIGMVAGFIGDLLQAVLPLIEPVISLVMAFVPLLDPLIKLTTSILVPLTKMLMGILPPVLAIAVGIVSVLVPAVVVVGDIIAKVFGGIGQIIIGAFQGAVDFVKGVLNTIGGLINGIIDGVNGFTGLGAAIGIHIGKIPHLPKLEKGGTVIQPGSVLVGEKGPEVLNLPRGASVVPLNRPETSSKGGDTFNIYETVSARATALQVSRRQHSLAAV